MDRMIYLSMSGAKATLQRQDVLSHNLANASTNGFRAELFDKIVGLNGHAVVQGYGGKLPDWRRIADAAAKTPGVTSARRSSRTPERSTRARQTAMPQAPPRHSSAARLIPAHSSGPISSRVMRRSTTRDRARAASRQTAPA